MEIIRVHPRGFRFLFFLYHGSAAMGLILLTGLFLKIISYDISFIVGILMISIPFFSFGRANIYFKAGMFKEAHKDYQDLVRLTPSDSTAHFFRFIAAKRAHMDESIGLQNYLNSINKEIWFLPVVKMSLKNTIKIVLLVFALAGCSQQSTENASTGKLSTTDVKIISIVSDQIGIPESAISLNSRIITDLGADELDLVELIMTVEETFMIEIADEAVAEKLKGESSGPRWNLTVRNLAELAEKK
jgi:acyl carrier protein